MWFFFKSDLRIYPSEKIKEILRIKTFKAKKHNDVLAFLEQIKD